MICDLCSKTGGDKVIHKFDLDYLKCHHCGHIYADVSGYDYVSQNETANGELSDVHDSKHESKRHIRGYQALLAEFKQYRKTEKLIEIGSSSGAFLRQAQVAGWQASGVEPVAASAEVGIREYQLDITVGVLEDAQYESESADVVYSNAVIEHVDSPSDLFAEAARILRTGGLFYADTVNIESYTWKFLQERWKLVDPRVHLHLFSPDSLRKLCAAAGLEVVKMTTHGVRFHATRADRPQGFARVMDELRKAPYSYAARRNLKGDNIAVYAVKI
ncbi:MAG: class I SAM-dependent methyltransferase [Pseudomonadota bacterium]